MASVVWAVLAGVIVGSWIYRYRRQAAGPVEDVI